MQDVSNFCCLASYLINHMTALTSTVNSKKIFKKLKIAVKVKHLDVIKDM
jgi:hypothetical protein